ncbi:MAG TPA: HPr family phosphocarrier protein [Kiritimatiellia bacterium]|nr:HPr family phosphocarrier protein [Kiritimatiellia bacterium]HMP00085.1 HPr family phosphocarrier protein [Kiritimatiellia bacterium]HMP97545.1 HPr family phosphocarrier protein [Kiritimatiellia bacterium]
MFHVEAIIQNDDGIHCRPSTMIIKHIGDYPGRVDICLNGSRVDARSMLGLLSLGLSKGTALVIEVEGPNEEELAQGLKILFETHFDFPRP